MPIYLSGDVTAPLPRVAGIINGVNGAVVAPVPTVQATIVLGVLFNGAVVAPFPSVASIINRYLGGAVVAPSPSANGTLLIGVAFDGAVRAPLPFVSAQLFTRALSGSPASPFPSASGSLAASIPMLNGAALAPVPFASGELRIVTTVSGTALVVNLSNKAPSRYSGYGLDSICLLNGVMYGVSKTAGIFTLDGSDDDGTPIDARVMLGELDFGVREHKRIPDIYLDVRADGDLSVLMSVDGNEPVEYTITTPSSKNIELVRQKLARGEKGGRWQPEIRNVNGSDFELQNIGMLIDVLARRV